MITDAIVSAFLGCIAALFGLMPNISIPAADEGGTTWIRYAYAFDGIFPLSFMMVLVGVSLAIHAILNIWDIALFIFHQFWGAS